MTVKIKTDIRWKLGLESFRTSIWNDERAGMMGFLNQWFRENHNKKGGRTAPLCKPSSRNFGLTLGELEPGASTLLSVFFPFLDTRVTSDKPRFLQGTAEFRISQH